MFRKVTVFSLQGGREARWKREADDPAMTHVVQNLCPGGYRTDQFFGPKIPTGTGYKRQNGEEILSANISVVTVDRSLK